MCRNSSGVKKILKIKVRVEGLEEEEDWNQQCCKHTGTLCSISMPDSILRRQLDSLHTCTCSANARRMRLNKGIEQTQPSTSVSLSAPFSPPCFLLSRWRKQRMSERERNKALILHTLTQHLCLSWFQMNKAEYQVAHLYATQRQIDQSITTGCCWITKLSGVCVCMCVRVYTRQPPAPPPHLLCLECMCASA